MIAWVLAASWVLAGCDTPTWVVLRAKCPDGGSANEQACAGSGPAPAEAIACKVHGQCPQASVCQDGQCVPCAKARALQCPQDCAWGWKAQPFTRNRCALCECAPPPGCQSSADCGTGMQCYRGQLCQEGCSELGCCFGNFCSFPGCVDPPALSCSVVGCAEGTCAGDASCAPPACKCDGKSFECSADCTAAVCKP